jgi:hypothetical protein
MTMADGHSLKVDDDVWLELIRLKYAGRYRSINDVIRVGIGMKPTMPLVHRYSDESGAGDDRRLCESSVTGSGPDDLRADATTEA